MERFRRFCGGSFRAKTVQKVDDQKIVKINGNEIKLVRSMSLTKVERQRRIFCVPEKLPENTEKRITIEHKVSIIFVSNFS